MKFKKVYVWEVLERIAKGDEVLMLDKKTKDVSVANTLEAHTVISAVMSTDESRFEFWVEEITEDKE